MTREALLLLCLNFSFIGLLPRIFFRKGGRLHLMWWLTALPLFAAPVVAVLTFRGILHALLVNEYMQLAGVTLNAISIALIALTIGTNRVPLALWHQQHDAPQNIVTFGAYRHIRHPFYASFLLAVIAAVLEAPHVITFVVALYAFVIDRLTERPEVADVNTSVVYEHIRRPVLEPLDART